MFMIYMIRDNNSHLMYTAHFKRMEDEEPIGIFERMLVNRFNSDGIKTQVLMF